MTSRDVYCYAVYSLAVLAVTLPHFLFNVTPHQYFNVTLSPVTRTIQWTSGTVDSLGEWAVSRSALLNALSDVRSANKRLRQQNKSLRLLARRYRRLRSEAGLPSDTPSFRPTAVEVYRSHLTAWERTVEINRGTESGISVGDPVVNVVGDSWVLYGQVLDTASGESRVVTTTDPRFKIGVVIEGIPGRQFVARGRGQSGLSIRHFPRILDVPLNAAVRTAPASTIAPRGLILGTVHRLTEAKIRPREGNELWIRPTLSDSIPSMLWVLTRP